MIKVKRLNGKEFVLNSDLILYIEETPDTIITLTTGQKVILDDTVDDIIKKVVEYKAGILNYTHTLQDKKE